MSPLSGYLVTAVVLALLTFYMNSMLKKEMNRSLKLYYFNTTGRAEQIRLILAYGAVPYEDIRFPGEEWMQKYKQSMPFGQVPVLEIDGKKYPQSTSIARYVAKLTDLTGTDELEDLEIDSVVDTLNDIGTKIGVLRSEKDESKRKELMKGILSETLPYYLDKLNARAGENDGYIALPRLTWADLVFVTQYEGAVNLLQTDLLRDYPNLRRVKENVLSLTNVKEYLRDRPGDAFGGRYSLKQDL